MKPLLTFALTLLPLAAVPMPVTEPPRTAYETTWSTPRTRIDEFIEARLTREKLKSAPPCSDAVFVRRIHLDLIGTLPTADEAATFIADSSTSKRAQLIERLFQREEFADYWAMRWAELLRVKAEFPINLWPNPAQAYHRLIRTSIRNNLPLDRFARGLLTATGSNMRVAESNFFRAVQNRDPKSLASAASLAFMGVRQDSWPPASLDALATCFSRVSYKTTSEWKEEIVYCDLTKHLPAGPLVMPDGKKLELAPDADPRVAFADWLVRPDNPWFSSHLANRTWFWIFGRGIIHEPDDRSPANPPSHPELLAWLAGEFQSHRCDFRHLLRLITNSRTYQQSPVSASGKPQNPALFASYPLRRLDAEVLVDALCAVTSSTESYESLIPEPFTFLPDGTRAIEIPDGSISSSFLDLFGRPSRDAGLAAERNPRPSADQRLHFLNSSHVRNKLEKSPLLRDLLRGGSKPNNSANDLYLTILSRHPNQDEAALFRSTLNAATNRKDALTDFAWALLNTTEFQCRH